MVNESAHSIIWTITVASGGVGGLICSVIMLFIGRALHNHDAEKAEHEKQLQGLNERVIRLEECCKHVTGSTGSR